MSKVTILDDLLRLGVRENCESPSLRLTKYLEIGDNTKAVEVNAVVACANKYVPQHVKETSLFTIPKQNGMDGVTIVATLKSRLIVNQAGGILENAGLCLHRHFGYPYIPGSAVKGLARHAAWCEWKAEEDEDKKLEIAKKIADVFGYPTGDKDGLDMYLASHVKEHSGSVCFMAAEPKGEAPLVADIVTCHHGDYYKNGGIALDNEEPNPQAFPTVENGAEFQFQIVPLRNCLPDTLKWAKQWLVEAITKHGIGAKIAAGYGWFAYEDLTGVEADPTIMDEILKNHPSATKMRDFCKNTEAWQEGAVFRKSLLEVVKTQPYNWKKNPNSKEMQNLKRICDEFGEEL